QQQIAASNKPLEKLGGLVGILEISGAVGGLSGLHGCANELRSIAPHAEDPVQIPELRGGPPALALEFGRGRAELEHFSPCEDSAAVTRGGPKKLHHRRQRRRTGIVGIVYYREARFEAKHLAALVGWLEVRQHIPGIGGTNAPKARGGKGRERVHSVV